VPKVCSSAFTRQQEYETFLVGEDLGFVEGRAPCPFQEHGSVGPSQQSVCSCAERALPLRPASSGSRQAAPCRAPGSGRSLAELSWPAARGAVCGSRWKDFTVFCDAIQCLKMHACFSLRCQFILFNVDWKSCYIPDRIYL